MVDTNSNMNEIEIKRKLREFIHYNKPNDLENFLTTYKINVNIPLDMVIHSNNLVLEWDDPSTFISTK